MNESIKLLRIVWLPFNKWHYNSIQHILALCVRGQECHFSVVPNKDINIGSCGFQCDASNQWIAQREVGPMYVDCDGMGCHVLCLRHGIPVTAVLSQAGTITIYRSWRGAAVV